MAEAAVARSSERVYERKAVPCTCADCQLTILLPTLRLASEDGTEHPLRLAWGHEDFDGAEATFRRGALYLNVASGDGQKRVPFTITSCADAAGIVGPHLLELGTENGQAIWLCCACDAKEPASQRRPLGY